MLVDQRARLLRAAVGFALVPPTDHDHAIERAFCGVLQVDAAERADFAFHRVIHTVLMERVSAYASTAHSIANERALASITATRVLRKDGKACEDARDSSAEAECHAGNLSDAARRQHASNGPAV
jgi:hypothetical protein